MKKSLVACTAATVLVAVAMFAPSKASAQVTIYVGPGGYGHYGYGAYPSYGYDEGYSFLWLLSSSWVWLLRRISRLPRWLLGSWTSGSASCLASSRALGLGRERIKIQHR